MLQRLLPKGRVILTSLETMKAKESVILKQRINLCEHASVLAQVKSLNLVPKSELHAHIQSMSATEFLFPFALRLKLVEISAQEILQKVLDAADGGIKLSTRTLLTDFVQKLMPTKEGLVDGFDPFKPDYLNVIAEAHIQEDNEVAVTKPRDAVSQVQESQEAESQVEEVSLSKVDWQALDPFSCESCGSCLELLSRRLLRVTCFVVI